MLCDSHVHFGQYYEMYTTPQDILTFMTSVGLDKVAISTTSSCEDNYTKVICEMKLLCQLLKHRVVPILWITPRLFDSTQDFENILHCGIHWKCVKIHPQLNPEFGNINFDYTTQAIETCKLLHLPLLIHTGDVKSCHPQIYEKYINSNQSVLFILAHGRPIDETRELLLKYSNVYADTAFMPMEHINLLVKSGLSSKILWGSDYPILQYWEKDINYEILYKQHLSQLESICSRDEFESITYRNFNLIFKCINHRK